MISRFPDSEPLIQYIFELRRRLCIPGYANGEFPPDRRGRFQDLFGKWPGEIDDGFEEIITATASSRKGAAMMKIAFRPMAIVDTNVVS